MNWASKYNWQRDIWWRCSRDIRLYWRKQIGFSALKAKSYCFEMDEWHMFCCFIFFFFFFFLSCSMHLVFVTSWNCVSVLLNEIKFCFQKEKMWRICVQLIEWMLKVRHGIISGGTIILVLFIELLIDKEQNSTSCFCFSLFFFPSQHLASVYWKK